MGSKRWACRRYWGEKSLTSGRWERAPERLEQQEGAVWGECEEAGSHFQSVVKVLRSALGPIESESISQSCPTLCYPIDCNPPSSSVHEILQARILEWVAIPFSRGSSQPRDRTQVSCIAADSLPSEPIGTCGGVFREPHYRIFRNQWVFNVLFLQTELTTEGFCSNTLFSNLHLGDPLI